MTITSDFLYVGVFRYYGSFTWVNNGNSLLKFSKNEGKLQWAKKTVTRNIMGNFYLTFNFYLDLVVNPRNQSQIMASVNYYCCSGNGQISGHYMINENGVDITTLYDYQYQPLNSPTVSNSGQISFDPETDHVYVSSTASLSSASYQDILLLKLDPTTGI